jgi:hypothetical protein
MQSDLTTIRRPRETPIWQAGGRHLAFLGWMLGASKEAAPASGEGRWGRCAPLGGAIWGVRQGRGCSMPPAADVFLVILL